jgi:general secretion pathway protein G
MLTPSTTRGVRTIRSGFTLLEVLVVVTILIILASVATFATMRYLRDAKINEANLKMQKIVNAINAYQVQDPYNGFPESLVELVVATEAGPPLLVGGEDAITDPWGNMFQVRVMNDQGVDRAQVFTYTPDQVEIAWPRN